MKSSLLVTVGYLLSPLSWWNDPFVNIPLAYLFALLCGLVDPRAFSPAMIAAYWGTNVAGLVLLHRGTHGFLEPRAGKPARAELAMDVVVSIAYTVIILLLMHAGIVRFPGKGITP
jgi:hypothetical protein